VEVEVVMVVAVMAGSSSATWLSEHNKRRQAGGSPNLSWSTKLANSAQQWANQMASSCSMSHSGKHGVGENVAYGYSSVAAVMQAWADSEKPNYNPSSHTCSGMCGHYTQVMWRMTNLVGCATANSRCDGRPMWVCQYIRPGNCNGYNWQSTSSPCQYFDDSQI